MAMQLTLVVQCDALDAIAEELRRQRLIAAHAACWPLAVDPVGPLSWTLKSEGEDDMLVYEFDLPTLPADDPAGADVVRGELRLTFDGAAQPVVETARDATVAVGVRIPQGAVVGGSFVFVDDAGNASLNATTLAEFTAVDTIPPPDAVGGLGARLVGEEA